METTQKRQIAYKVSAKEITEGSYVKESGWLPNYILIRGKKVSRINLIGVVVELNEKNNSNTAEKEMQKEIVLEDKTGRIAVRSFEPMDSINKLNVGDIINIIGRPREFNNEKYVVPEIIRKIEKGWFELRVLELGSENHDNSDRKEQGNVEKKEKNIEERIIDSNIDPEEIMRLIKVLDKGDGADYEEVLAKVKNERLIRILLEEGEIFEIRPGKLKIL